MIRFVAAVVMAGTLGAGCGGETGPPVAVSDIRVLAPLPGRTAAVAYLTISNLSSGPLLVTAIRSPQFERVEMHETVVDDDGIARMIALPQVPVGAGEAVVFSEGGKHLMLIGAGKDVLPGSPVTLEIEHSDGLLIVNAAMRNRPAAL